jgi:pyruvate/2-oxoglutarate dehydrogenase complex dihydrolipoamide dehydrogenase (E3) component
VLLVLKIYPCIIKSSFFAAGRAPNSKRLNLEKVGVEVDKSGAIKVSSRLFSHLHVYISFPRSLET